MTLARRSFRFRHHPEHVDRPREPPCAALAVPEVVLEFVRALPRAARVRACDAIGHPSFWLGPGYRYVCFCGEITYHD
jgi:hypothetical protein